MRQLGVPKTFPDMYGGGEEEWITIACLTARRAVPFVDTEGCAWGFLDINISFSCKHLYENSELESKHRIKCRSQSTE